MNILGRPNQEEPIVYKVSFDLPEIQKLEKNRPSKCHLESGLAQFLL